MADGTPSDGRRVPAPTDRLLAEALVDPGVRRALAAALAGTGRVAAIGVDRLRPDADGASRVDPSVIAQELASDAPTLGVLVVVTPTRDHPYNTARRILSLDHLLGGRAGVLVGGEASGGVDAGRRRAFGDDDVWTDAPDSPERRAEYVRLLRGLWNTWPLDSIVADKASGVFAHSSRIVDLAHEGSWTVRGPLNTPSSVQAEPVVAALGDAVEGADVVLTGIEVVDDLASVERLAVARDAAGIGPETGQEATSATAGPAPASTLREVLGLAPRTLDTSDWARTSWEAVR